MPNLPTTSRGSGCAPTYAASPASRTAALVQSIGRTGSVDYMLSKFDPQRPNLTPGEVGHQLQPPLATRVWLVFMERNICSSVINKLELPCGRHPQILSIYRFNTRPLGWRCFEFALTARDNVKKRKTSTAAATIVVAT